MRYPNSRYGNPVEFQYYAQGQTAEEIAKRDKRTVQRWLNGKQKMPWWIPERTDLTLMKWMLGLIVAGVAALVLKSFF